MNNKKYSKLMCVKKSLEDIYKIKEKIKSF